MLSKRTNSVEDGIGQRIVLNYDLNKLLTDASVVSRYSRVVEVKSFNQAISGRANPMTTK